MKTIIAGSRDVTSLDLVRNAVKDSGFTITEVVSGKAKGVDTLGEEIAKELGVPVAEFPADWKGLGRKAGPLRNIQMGDYADALVAVRLNNSRGTTHMIDYARKRGLSVFVLDVESEE